MFSCRGWPQADRFAGGLRCGMSVDDVRARARASGAAQFIADARLPTLYGTYTAARGASRVYLGFAAGRLRWVRRGAQAGLWTGMRVGLKRDLCDGRELASLVIHGSPQWSSAAVTINGRDAGTLSAGPASLLQTDVPIGRSDLLIRSRDSTYHRRLFLDHDSDGVIQIDIPD